MSDVSTAGGLTMVSEERNCELNVSEFYLKLTTEAIRLFSNKMHGLCNFSQVINSRASTANTLIDYYTAKDMREHLSIIPTGGDIPLRFTILETSAASIDEAAAMLQAACGASVAFGDALSLLLYDLIVEENKTEVLSKLGLSAEHAERYRKSLKRTPNRVVPFR